MDIELTYKRILSENLKRLMDERQVSARVVAEKCRLSNKTVSNMLNASHAASIDTIETVCKFLGVEPWEVLIDGVPMDEFNELTRLIKNYLKLNEESRVFIQLAIKRESR